MDAVSVAPSLRVIHKTGSMICFRNGDSENRITFFTIKRDYTV